MIMNDYIIFHLRPSQTLSNFHKTMAGNKTIHSSQKGVF